MQRELRAVLLHECLPDGSCSCGNRNGTCPSPTGKDATGKHPRRGGWLDNLIVDEAGATKAWGEFPTANIGLCPREDEFVLDIDPRHGGDETFAKLVAEMGEPDGPHARTGGGGDHYWMKLPPGTDIKVVTGLINRKLKALGPGIDLRTCHHQVVVEPSMHKSGRRYQWVQGRSILECDPVMPSQGWLTVLGLGDAAEERATGTKGSTKYRADDDLARATWGLLHARLLDPDRGYVDWFRIGAALKCFGDAGLHLWIEASRTSKDFDEAEIRRKWPSITGSSIASLFGMFDDVDPTWRHRFRTEHPERPEADGQTSQAPPPAQDGGDIVPLGQRDPKTGRLVLSERRTLPTADAYVREFHTHSDGRTLHTYGGSLLAWQGNRYVVLEDGGVRQKVHPWLHNALRYVPGHKSDKPELRDFQANPTTVNAAVTSIQTFTHLPLSTPIPSWLAGGTDRPPPYEILPCKTANLHIPTGLVLPATPALFNFNALGFDYDPQVPEPTRWYAFLRDLFGDDTESVNLLQEWFGYCLTADTRQQKILLVIGPRRSGKGTIARILSALVGAGNVVGPTVSSLAGTFGLQPLLGKSLAVVSDARFTGEGIAILVERLLCISGEDAITVDVKFKDPVTLKLPVKFVFLSNELPRFNDASTALAGRFLVLKLTKSFFGNENIRLTDELMPELPGILLWAVHGWVRLHDRGRFLEPESSRAAVQDIEDLSSPVGAFVRERCVVGVGHRVTCTDLYQAWCVWCAADGRTVNTTTQVFGRDLAAAVPGVTRRRCTNRPPFYDGIGLSTGETP